MTRAPPHKRNVGFVFQNYALFPHLDVMGNVGFGLKGRGLAKPEIAAKAQRALDLVQLGSLSGRPISALSGGQQQRIALARALAVEPSVMLFDEALSALDRSLRETMQIELRRLLKGLGATAIFVTHDQDEALTMSDRVAVMNRGRIEQYADPQALYSGPATLFAMRFVGVSSELSGKVVEADGERSDNRNARRVFTRAWSIGAWRGGRLWRRGPNMRASPRARTADGFNAVTGRIKQITFQGARKRIALDIGERSDFLVEIGGAAALPPIAERRARWPSAAARRAEF